MIRVIVALLVAVISAGVSGNLATAQQAQSCAQFASQAEAQAAYAADPSDPAGNDEDADGIACENVIYGNTATDFTPVQATAATETTEPAARGIGASGTTEAADTSETATRGIGASGTSETADTSETAASGVGAAGTTPARGIGASGTTEGGRTAVAGSMTTMPATGVGPAESSSWLVPTVWLLAAVAAGWLSIRNGAVAGPSPSYSSTQRSHSR